MRDKIFTNFDAMTLKVMISLNQDMDVRLIVRDSDQQDTVLTDRVRSLGPGEQFFFVRMPLCRKYVDVIIQNEAGGDAGITYKGCKKLPLERRLDVVDFNNAFHLNEFINFIQQFCYNAGVLRTNDPDNDNDYYISQGKNFLIKYLPSIIDYETGQQISTPARISNDSAIVNVNGFNFKVEHVIEVSREDFLPYTVPMRMATLTHEYSHPYMNEDPNDESEADINGLWIYLGLGYPRIDAAEAWCNIFTQADTEENIQRIAIIKQFIDHFEERQVVFYS